MRELEYSEAAVEVLDILKYTNKEDVEQIPKSFIKFLKNIASKTYKPQFNHENPVGGLNLKEKTKELLGFIYITWWCDKNEREKYKKQIHEENIKKVVIKEQYNINDIFKNRKEEQKQETTINTNEIAIIEYKEKNIFKKIINIILDFVKGKKRGDTND